MLITAELKRNKLCLLKINDWIQCISENRKSVFAGVIYVLQIAAKKDDDEISQREVDLHFYLYFYAKECRDEERTLSFR